MLFWLFFLINASFINFICSFWKETPGKAENERINLKLIKANDSLYNEFSYANVIQDKNGCSNDSLLPSVIEGNSDYGYAEESYVDNSEAFSDSFPSGKVEFNFCWKY